MAYPMKALSLAAIAVCCISVAAAPSDPRTTLQDRQLDGVVKGVLGDISNALDNEDRDGVLSALHKLQPAKTPASVEEAVSIVQAVANSSYPTVVEYSAHLIANGIISGTVEGLFDYAKGLVSDENSSDNSNPDPESEVYPQVASCDAPYTTSESDLRSAIYIPTSFTYGEKPPVILFPGTGGTGYTTFAGNFIPLLSDVDWADPVWVNVPHFLLDDAQVNAEYAAYAINYIASLTGCNVSVIGWSQGNIDTQWAFKYWPSTREVTSDHVAISADYRGTVLANLIGVIGVLNDPSVVQQQAGSEFIKTMRSDGGDSGYVPTTSVFSSFFDEIVEPQSGEGASAYLLDARGVGVTNNEVQVKCAGELGGSFYTHEGMLANPLAFALAKDALTHEGPGETSRLDLDEVCSGYLAPGLGLEDFLITENAILIAALALGLYLPKVLEEPEIMDYATTAASC